MALTPDAPAILSASDQAKWKARYAEGYKQGLIDASGNETEAHQRANKYANQMLRVPEITSIEHAKSLPGWMILKLDEASGKVVTADGQKYQFEKSSNADDAENADKSEEKKGKKAKDEAKS